MRPASSSAARSLGRRIRLTHASLLIVIGLPLLSAGTGLFRHLEGSARQIALVDSAGRLRQLADQAAPSAWQLSVDGAHHLPEELDAALKRWDAQARRLDTQLAPLCPTNAALCAGLAGFRGRQQAATDIAQRQLFGANAAQRLTQLRRFDAFNAAYATDADQWTGTLVDTLGVRAADRIRFAASAAAAAAALLLLFLVLKLAVRRLRIERAALRLPLPMREHLYQIAREAVNNSLKHAQAKRIVVTLTVGATVISLAVDDDGIGFEPVPGRAAGLGLQSLGLRARALRGRL